MSGCRLKARNLTKIYRRRQVVGGVSIEVKRGEVVGLLGPNGAGKTTCFYLIVGLLFPDRGKIFLEEKEITREPLHRRARLGIGYLPQEPSIFRQLTVEENLLAVLELREELTSDQRQLFAEELLQMFHLDRLAQQKALTLSGGERRRLEIARALALEPKFLLLDEPFAGVDPISIDEIKQILSDLQKQQIGILITDHNVAAALSICQRAYILDRGEILAQGVPEEILQHEKVRQVYLGEHFHL